MAGSTSRASKAYLPVFRRVSRPAARRPAADLESNREHVVAASPRRRVRAVRAYRLEGRRRRATGVRRGRLAPQILGGHGTRRYLVLFVTPAKLRGSGGLIANYGVLVAQNGVLRLEGLGRGPLLDDAGSANKHLDGPKEYLARYGRFEPANTWENVTMSPDFPAVAEVAAALFPQSGGTHVDGVISLDPVALSDLLSSPDRSGSAVFRGGSMPKTWCNSSTTTSTCWALRDPSVSTCSPTWRTPPSIG